MHEVVSPYRKFNLSDNSDLRALNLDSAIISYLGDQESAENAGVLAHRRWKIATFMENSLVKTFFMSLVCLNGLLIGIQLDYGGDQATWDIIAATFLFAFTVEAGFRIVGLGRLFFLDYWNILDFTVVVS